MEDTEGRIQEAGYNVNREDAGGGYRREDTRRTKDTGSVDTEGDGEQSKENTDGGYRMEEIGVRMQEEEYRREE